MKLEEILRQPEGKTLEYKRDLSSPAPALRTLVAFANAAGGRLVVGVEDATRAVVGVERPLDLEQRIANLVADSPGTGPTSRCRTARISPPADRRR